MRLANSYTTIGHENLHKAISEQEKICAARCKKAAESKQSLEENLAAIIAEKEALQCELEHSRSNSAKFAVFGESQAKQTVENLQNQVSSLHLVVGKSAGGSSISH